MPVEAISMPKGLKPERAILGGIFSSDSSRGIAVVQLLNNGVHNLKYNLIRGQ